MTGPKARECGTKQQHPTQAEALLALPYADKEGYRPTAVAGEFQDAPETARIQPESDQGTLPGGIGYAEGAQGHSGGSPVKVWVALDVEEASLVGVAATAELAKEMAEEDNGSDPPLTWRERSDGRFIAGPIDYPVYRVQQFDVIERPDTPGPSTPAQEAL